MQSTTAIDDGRRGERYAAESILDIDGRIAHLQVGHDFNDAALLRAFDPTSAVDDDGDRCRLGGFRGSVDVELRLVVICRVINDVVVDVVIPETRGERGCIGWDGLGE